MNYHTPVLLKESIDGLSIKPEGRYVDLTYGGGGHAREILKKLTTGKLIAFDQDQDAVPNRIDDDRLLLLNHNFRYLKNFLLYYGELPVDGILADLGVSSFQIDNPERGFSTRNGKILDMRMNKEKELSARDIVNQYPENSLSRIFSTYGEIKNANVLTKVIVKERNSMLIETIDHFKKTIIKCAPREKENKYLAQVFQALRIEVNQELASLKEMLSQTIQVLKPGGRIVVISYHSLEDRLVKNFFRSGNFEGVIEKDFFGKALVDLRAISKKPIIPSENEITNNPRARSAKMRIAEKI
ncbi:MAG: 16S rRNA (cytosine(1402)-N(4))-methyltransferase RsmH [Bacteroidales bacterium]|nr:16S rRNA (cytosine(1402)-N(4))-methyltransferase RsmH [Bacteroidales bacterium]